MIKINLLGDALGKAAATKKVDKTEIMKVYGEEEAVGRTPLPIAGIMAGLLFASFGGVYYLYLNDGIQKRVATRDRLQKERDEYKKYIDLEKKFRERKDALQKKEEIMMGLRKAQLLPVHFLEELANSLPDDVWFANVQQAGMKITIKGQSRSFEAVNTFYLNLQSRSRWFKSVDYPGSDKKGSNVSFTISFELQNAV